MRWKIIPFYYGPWNERPGKRRRVAIYALNFLGVVAARENDGRWLEEIVLK